MSGQELHSVSVLIAFSCSTNQITGVRQPSGVCMQADMARVFSLA